MSTMLQDLRHGARLLLRSPGFTLVAITALAIGIGANTAIFSVVHTLLLQRLPYKDPDRIAALWEHNIPRDKKNNVISPGNFIHWREMQQSFEDIAAVSGQVGLTFKVTVTGAGEPEEVPMQLVSSSFFPILGVQPALGRVFTPEEDRPNSRVTIISERFWRRKLSADPGILQRSLTINGNPYTVAGVMPLGFSYLDKTTDIWIPVGFSAESRTPRGRWMGAVGRLKPGVTFAQAQSDMTRVHAELTRLFPEFNTGWTARVVPLRQEMTGEVRPALLILLGAVAFVLLIACANVANLLLARASVRQRELAVRSALGAGRGRLVRQLLAESVVLAAAGGVAGLLLAWWALHLLRAVVAERLPIQRLEMVGIDGWVLVFTLGASLLSGIVFGLVPALTASGGGLSAALKEGGRSGSAAGGNRTRSVFVVVEIALALVLLVGAGLLIRSFVHLVNVDPGFNPERTITMTISLPGSRYGNAQQRVQFFQRLFSKVDALPGVQAAGAISFLPLAGGGAATSYEVVGQPVPPLGQEPVTDVRVITNRYLEAMGTDLVRGRLFDEANPDDAKNRIVVNETLARKHWPKEDALGKRIKISWNDTREDEIIGVVRDVKNTSLEAETKPTIYWPHPRFAYPGMTLAIRTATEPASIVNSVLTIVREQDPLLAVSNIQTMDEVLSRSVAQRRLVMMMLAVFAGAALVLAAVGIYGVIAYGVTQRTQEIGIRMALGAQRADVLRMVVGSAMALAAAGILIGGVSAYLLTKLMTKLLFDVQPGDPTTFAAVAGVLATVAAAASYIPGLRATRVDPVVALRSE